MRRYVIQVGRPSWPRKFHLWRSNVMIMCMYVHMYIRIISTYCCVLSVYFYQIWRIIYRIIFKFCANSIQQKRAGIFAYGLSKQINYFSARFHSTSPPRCPFRIPLRRDFLPIKRNENWGWTIQCMKIIRACVHVCVLVQKESENLFSFKRKFIVEIEIIIFHQLN